MVLNKDFKAKPRLIGQAKETMIVQVGQKKTSQGVVTTKYNHIKNNETHRIKIRREDSCCHVQFACEFLPAERSRLIRIKS